MVTWFQRLSRRTPIGVDIGRTGARAVQLTRAGASYTMTGAALIDWTDGAASADPDVPTLAERLRRCAVNGGFRDRRAVLGLAPPTVEFHAMELPPALLHGKESEVQQIVRIELGRLANQDADLMETRCWTVPVSQTAAPNVIGVAAKRDAVLEQMKVCHEAGLDCESVDATAAALARFGALLAKWTPESVWGVLDLGFEAAQLVLCVDGCPVLVRRAGAGGGAWTERIAEALQVTPKTAEVHKCGHGIALPRGGDRSGSGEADHEIASILHGALRSELHDLASEIKRSYEYVLSCYPGRRAADLILVGGGSATRNLPEFLGEVLGIPVHLASDYLGTNTCRLQFTSAGRDRLEQYAAAIGLAVKD